MSEPQHPDPVREALKHAEREALAIHASVEAAEWMREAALSIALQARAALADSPLGRVVAFDVDDLVEAVGEPNCRGSISAVLGDERYEVLWNGEDGEKGNEKAHAAHELRPVERAARVERADDEHRWEQDAVWATVVIDPESMEPTEITDRRFLEELSETGVSLERMFIRPGRPRVEQVGEDEREPIKHTADHRVETSTSGLHKRCTEPGCEWAYEYD